MRSHSPRTRTRAGVSLLLAACVCLPVSAEVYQWRDSAGKLHFGDRPPAAADYQRFTPSGGIAAKATPSSEREAQTLQAGAAEAEDECAERRETLARYRDADRLVQSTEDGGERRLSETEREEIIAMQQGLVDRACD